MHSVEVTLEVEVTLDEKQLEKLLDGESIKVNSLKSQKQVTIKPPCGEFGHNWGRYKIDRDASKDKESDEAIVLARTCERCREREENELNAEEAFS